MLQSIRSFIIRLLCGVNIAIVVLMFVVQHADKINPQTFPDWCNVGLFFPVFAVINLFFLILWAIIRLRLTFVPVIGFALCYSGLNRYIPMHLLTSEPQDAIKVMTYNVYLWGGWETDKQQVKKFVDYIVGEKPDVVCLQEAKLGKENLLFATTLLKENGYTAVYEDKGMSDDRLMTLTRHKLIESYKIAYNENNFSLAIKTLIGGDTVTVINNHFESTNLTVEDRKQFSKLVEGEVKAQQALPEWRMLMSKLGASSAIRKEQVDVVANYLDSVASKNVILCGDFNDHPLSYTLRQFDKRLVNTYVETGCGPGISYRDYRFYVRIDNIFCSDDWQPYYAKVDKNIKLSDHYPVCAWIKKRPKD